jgi:predicted transposase YdaD
MEEIMTSTDWPVYTPWAREHYGRGHEEGLTEGKAEGKAEEAARSVLLVLAARGVHVTDEARGRIESCADVEQLERWIARAAVAGTPEELFETPCG